MISSWLGSPPTTTLIAGSQGDSTVAAALNDVAPTLAVLLELDLPRGSTERVLIEALEPK